MTLATRASRGLCCMAAMLTVIAISASAPTSAQITDVRVVQVEQAVLPGYVVNDVLFDFTGELTNAELFVYLSEGEIYQDLAGGIGAPNAGIFGFLPSLEFDTFIAFGGRTSQDADKASPGIAGPAIDAGFYFSRELPMDLSFSRAETFSAALIDVTYFTFPLRAGVTISDRSDYFVARITLSDDAMGLVGAEGAAADRVSGTFPFSVVNGRIVPEPAAGLGLLGSMLLVKRRAASRRLGGL